MKQMRMKHNETGRSMVEMLGVLAIAGVLSVGGVYGYGVAIKKHKANELLHQASMLAATISAQAMSNDGKLPETTTSFGNSSYGTFDPSVTEALDGKGFSIEISNMDSAVCTQLEKMAGGIVRKATCDGTTATITYYKNLATNDEEENNDPTDTPTQQCGEHGTWGGSSCNCDTGWGGTDCSIDTSCSGKGTWNGTSCDCNEGSGGDDCSLVLYCAWTGWLNSGNPDNTQTGDDIEPVVGICNNGWVADISCRAVIFPNTPLDVFREEEGQAVTCDTTEGLVCKSAENVGFPDCLDYEINVYCCFWRKKNA